MVYYEITGDEMTPPEDKAPDMPLKNIKQMCADMETIETFLDGCAGRFVGDALHINIAELAKAIRARTPIQSPDQGAVEALGRVARLIDNEVAIEGEVFVGVCKDLQSIRQALTRPPLDLAGLRRNAYSPIDNTYLNNQHGGWNACLDHLQAIRPDLFGGKKI